MPGFKVSVELSLPQAHPDNSGSDGRCRGRGCSYQAQAGSRANRATRTFATLAAATAWKRDMDALRADGRIADEQPPTLREAADRWHADAKAGIALGRGLRPLKDSTISEYRRYLDQDLLDDYGTVRLDDLADSLDDIVETLQRRGLAPSTIRNTLMPLRAVYRYAVKRRWVAFNPTLGLEVPTGSGRRMKVIEVKQIALYLGALHEHDRALWATALHAGLRRGELMALRWDDVDVAGGVITIDRQRGNYDQKTRTVQGPKSDAGARTVPINATLREILIAHRSRAGARRAGFVFARGVLAGTCRAGSEQMPFNDSTTGQRARQAWITAGLPPISLHDCRHTFASIAIAAMASVGVFNPKLLQQVMGHSSIQVTYDRYGHLFPGEEAQLGRMLDDYVGADALPAVAQAWSRMNDELDSAADTDARPVVAQALEVLGSWQRANPCDPALPSAVVVVQSGREHPASVQRRARRQEP